MESYIEHYDDKSILLTVTTESGLPIPLELSDIRYQKYRNDKARGAKITPKCLEQDETLLAQMALIQTDADISRPIEDIYDSLLIASKNSISHHTREKIEDKKAKRAAYLKLLE